MVLLVVVGLPVGKLGEGGVGITVVSVCVENLLVLGFVDGCGGEVGVGFTFADDFLL